MAKGFNRGSQVGGNTQMMSQLHKLQAQMEAAQNQIAQEVVTATAGGGAIKITMTGDQKCQQVEIDAEFLKDADAEMLSDMVLAAVNMALDKTREIQDKLMGPLAGGLPF